MADIEIPRAWRRQHRDALRALLGAEDKALATMTAAVSAAVARHAHEVGSPDATRRAAMAAADDIERSLAAVIERARFQARRAARVTLTAEVELARSQAQAEGLGALDGLEVRAASDDPNDGYRARDAARSYARDWLAAAMVGVATDTPKPLRAATKQQAHRVALTAATENSEAFSRERMVTTAKLADVNRGFPVLFNLWDATLDKRTCSTCAKLAGRVTPWGFAFPDRSTPGAVHPRCRCAALTIFLPVYWRQGADKAA